MMIRRWMLLVVVLVGAVLSASCGGADAQPATDPEVVTAPATQQPADPTEAAAPPTQQPAEPTEAAAPPTQQPADPAPPATATPVPATATPVPATATPVPATAPTGGGTLTVDLEEIFPPGEGRELVFRDCTGCHTWVVMVIMQMTREDWTMSSREHRDRVISATDEEFNMVYEYLAENFNPDKPVPELPQQLLDTWTDY